MYGGWNRSHTFLCLFLSPSLLFSFRANLVLTFTEPDLTNMLLNALALEFICLLDNEMEEMYFKLVPQAAVEIYDTYFKESEIQSKAYYVCCIPWKILLVALCLFPLCCFTFIFYGSFCK